MIKIRCDERPQDSIELTEEQIADLLQFDGTNDLSLPWGEVYGGVGPHYAEIYVNAGDLSEEGAWLTRESFEGLREHLTEIVQVPRHEVRPGEEFSHYLQRGPVFTALDPFSRYWMDSDFLPAASNGGGLMDTLRSDMVYVRRPKEVKPDRLAGLRKVFPDADDYEEHSTSISCVVQTTLTLETLLRLREEYPKGEIAIEADGNQTVGIFVDGV